MSAWPSRFTSPSSASASARNRPWARDHASRPRPRCAINAACTFSNTVSFGKMLVRWNDRPTPSAQSRYGAMPVTSRPPRCTLPESARRWPVMRLNSVDLPAPFGPMMATISRRSTARLTPSIAATPPNERRRLRTSSMTAGAESRARGGERADDPAGEREQERHQHDAEDERPVLRDRSDLVVEERERGGADRRAPEAPHPAEDRHDQHLGGLRPVREVGEDAAVEDAEERPGEAGERAGDRERHHLVQAHVQADELRALGILADRGEHVPER